MEFVLFVPCTQEEFKLSKSIEGCMKNKREGFLLVWCEVGIFLLLTITVGITVMLLTVFIWQEQAENRWDRTLLAQEVMEKIKYEITTGEQIYLPEDVIIRNEKPFYVEVCKSPEEIEGVTLLRVKVTITDREGKSTEFSTWIDNTSVHL